MQSLDNNLGSEFIFRFWFTFCKLTKVLQQPAIVLTTIAYAPPKPIPEPVTYTDASGRGWQPGERQLSSAIFDPTFVIEICSPTQLFC